MTDRSVEQLLHGYRRGHEQLASSIKLPSRDTELVTRLSDLSGSLASVPNFTSYLTIYPLPSGEYFALARTWPDPDAARAGCVLTHTLLVPSSTWATLAEPRAIESLFTFPTTRSASEYRSTLFIPEYVGSVADHSKIYKQKSLITFVRRYFGEGKVPIVWFGQDQPEEILWRLLRGLWPKLRGTFSACTFCLQPRTLEDRFFELMFAPAAISPRFQRISSDHIIDQFKNVESPARDDKDETWTTEWTRQLFGASRELDFPSTDPDLWTGLDEDPTAIRRLFLIEGLAAGEDLAPQVFVGAMDLVESLAKGKDSAVARKRRVAERAVRAARESGNPTDGLESLRLIEDRLRRSSFSRVQNEVGPSVIEALATITRKFPDITAEYIGVLASDLHLSQSWLGLGLLQGFRLLAHDEPSKLLVFRNVPSIVGYFLTAEPEIGAAFIREAASQKLDSNTRADLLRWLENVDYELRRTLRSSLVSELGPDDTDILAELLKDLHAEEIDTTLGVLWRQTNHFETTGIRDLVIQRFAHDFPADTRDWTQRVSRWNPNVAHVYAATYQPTRQGLLELLDNSKRLARDDKAEATAAFLKALGPGRLPYWLTDIAHSQSSLIEALLGTGTNSSTIVTEQTQRLLTTITFLPIAHWSSLGQQVLASSKRPFFETLRNLAMRSLISGYIAGGVSEPLIRSFQEHQEIVPWFNKLEPRDFRSLVAHSASSSTVHWSNTWRWIAIAPRAFYVREPTLLPDLVDSLSRSYVSKWSEEISNLWSQILRRARSQSSQRTSLVLCVQALKFSFSNTHLPLGPLVAESFHDVYAAATTSILSSETASLFSFFDWDKGKELRRLLVDCFGRSRWPPGYLALAVTEVSLLRKVFKRIMRRTNGERYARSMLADLEQRSDSNAMTLAQALRRMLAKPDFYEEWD